MFRVNSGMQSNFKQIWYIQDLPSGKNVVGRPPLAPLGEKEI